MPNLSSWQADRSQEEVVEDNVILRGNYKTWKDREACDMEVFWCPSGRPWENTSWTSISFGAISELCIAAIRLRHCSQRPWDFIFSAYPNWEMHTERMDVDRYWPLFLSSKAPIVLRSASYDIPINVACLKRLDIHINICSATLQRYSCFGTPGSWCQIEIMALPTARTKN